MNPEAVLAVLPSTREEAKSMKEIALALGSDIYSHIVAKTLASAFQNLRALQSPGAGNYK